MKAPTSKAPIAQTTRTLVCMISPGLVVARTVYQNERGVRNRVRTQLGEERAGWQKAERVHWTQIGKDAEKPNRQAIEIAGKWLVDVTGIELVIPCLQISVAVSQLFGINSLQSVRF